MARESIVGITANFALNLEEIERFLADATAQQACDGLRDELRATVIPNLERFPGMGRPFLPMPPRSVETTNALATLRTRLLALTTDTEALREYLLEDHLLRYAQIGDAVHLLAVRCQRRLSSDFERHRT